MANRTQVRRPHVITVKLSEGEKRLFQKVARRLGLDVSAMLRALVSGEGAAGR